MTRKWIDYPQNIQLSTLLGNIYLTVTERNCINVDASRDGRYIIVNKVEYHTSFGLIKQSCGSYQLNKYGIRGDRTYSCSKGNYYADQMTDAAKAKIIKVILPLVNEWAVSNQEVLDKAEYAHINNKIYFLENEIGRETSTLQTKQQELLDKALEIKQLTKVLGEEVPIINIPLCTPESQYFSGDPVETIKQAIVAAIPQIWEEKYIKSVDKETLELETLGILVSKFTEWTGDFILKIAIAAMEDANFKTEAEEIKVILRKVQAL